MKISEIKNTELRELAEKRRKEDGGKFNTYDSNYLDDAFFWSDTPEGDGFWGKVYDGIITEK